MNKMSSMKEAITYVLNAYRNYNETGMYMALFYCSLFYLWYQDKSSRRTWVYPSLLFLVLIINPIVSRYGWFLIFDWASSPRLYWMLPTLPVIAIAATHIISKGKGIKEKVITGVFLCLIILACGRIKYNSEYFVKPQNVYNLPQEAIEIADFATSRMDNPRLVVPMELATCMRIYRSDIRLLYGEDATFGRIKWIVGTPQQEVYNQMVKETPDLISTNGLFQELECDYVVFDNGFHKDYEKLAECGYHLATTVGQYDVYERDTE